ncbi:MAG TPA: lysophospholipid acyltransferase family protein [Verrucomicrobiae bacterium]|nr:lysophospholipid acyltransferase family protein [Verrucomicrobiae bacterium]
MSDREFRSVHWSGTGRLRGGRRGVQFFLVALRILGLRLTYALTIPVAAYFSFASPDVPATMDFHRRAFGPQPWWKRRWLVFKHFHSFGIALIDRVAVLAGKTKLFSFTFDGEKHLRGALAEGRGVLVLTAHLGNWEAAGQMLSRLDVPITVTGFDKENPEVRAMINRASREQKFKLVPLTGSPTDAIPLVAALRRGEVVAMLGDRAYGSPAARISFFGGIASFPIGAYVLAAIAGAPLVHVFSLREPGGHYHFFGFPPQRPQMPPHDQRDAYLENCAARFAENLEGVLRRDPLQWYNFYPFWKTETAETTKPSTRTRPRILPPRPEPAPTKT